jgi:quinol monooxygenase YgiN
MLIVAGTFRVEAARRDEFIASREAAMQTARGEAGCFEYVMAADPLEADRVVLYERWESRPHLDEHLTRSRQAAGGPDPAAVPVLFREVIVYEIASEAPLG